MTNDMTVGNPTKLIMSFALPLIIGNIFQQLYSMVDTLIVGRTIGVSALAAVGATGAIAFLIIGFVFGVTSGFSVITAQYFGAGDYDGVRRSVGMSVILSVAVTVIVTLISVLTAYPLLKFMNTPEDIIERSYIYIIIIFWGIFSIVFYNLLSSIIRALGDSKTPLIFLIIASVLNIVLDFVLILFVHMGVAGAAVATVVSEFVSGVLCLLYVIKKFDILRLSKKDFAFSWDFAWKHLRVGLPMAFQFSITAIGVMVLQAVLNKFGSVTVGAFTTASKIENLLTQVYPAIGTTIATYAAQNYGAGKYRRIRAGVRSCMIISFVYSAAAGVFSVFAGKYLTMLFVGNDQPLVVEQAQIYLNCIAVFFVFLGILFIYRNVLQAIGKGTFPLLAGVSELLLRIFMALYISGFLGYVGVCLAGPIAWVGAAVLLFIAYIVISSAFPEQIDKEDKDDDYIPEHNSAERNIE